MLQSLVSITPFIEVTGATQGTIHIPPNYGSGQVRYHNNVLQVYDGNVWQNLSTSYADITLSANATDAINWALKKMTEEVELQRLANEHPSVRVAYETFKRAGEQLKTTIILSKDEQTTT